MKAPASSLLAPQRILVRGVNWLGDAVMTTPALLRLREAHPNAQITLLTPAKLADLWKDHPALNGIIAFQPGEGLFAVSRKLRQERCEVALILPNSPRSALETFFARIPQRIGHSRPWRNLFLTRRVVSRPEEVRMHKRSRNEIQALIASPSSACFAPPAKAHHLYQYLHLAKVLGASGEPLPPLIAVAEDEVAAVRRKFGVPTETRPRPLLGLNAGAEYGPAKRWPRERFVAAAVALQKKLDCRWWIFGGHGETDLASTIAGEIQAAQAGPRETVRCLAGETNLRQLCAALKACELVLTNDTGPMHLAAAVGTRVVVPYGSTSPELTGPGLPGDARHRLLSVHAPCAPCFLRECPIDFRCMTGLTVETTIAAVIEALGSIGSRPS